MAVFTQIPHTVDAFQYDGELESTLAILNQLLIARIDFTKTNNRFEIGITGNVLHLGNWIVFYRDNQGFRIYTPNRFEWLFECDVADVPYRSGQKVVDISDQGL